MRKPNLIKFTQNKISMEVLANSVLYCIEKLITSACSASPKQYLCQIFMNYDFLKLSYTPRILKINGYRTYVY